MPKLNQKLCGQEPFETYIRAWHELPVGKIIGKVTLESTWATGLVRTAAEMKRIDIPDIERELLFGDYTTGRRGWYCIDPVRFKTPVPAKGHLGLWEYNGPLI